MRTKFQEIENTVNDRVKKIFDKLNAGTLIKRLEVFDYEDECVEDGDEKLLSIKLIVVTRQIFVRQ